MSDNVKKILLVGTGAMAKEYVKVLEGLNETYLIVGNRKESVDEFNKITGKQAIYGGIEQYLKTNDATKLPKIAIVTVNSDKLYKVAKQLIDAGVERILLEKPGALFLKEIHDLKVEADKKNVQVFIAYNRRFYSSVKKAEEIIQEDGGILSLNFEFTEWKHVIEKTSNSDTIKQKWFLANSSHVVDLAFYFAGKPRKVTTYKKGELSWHKAGSIYAGCGITEKDVIFSYQANWDAPGRWGVEILTAKHRLYFRPLEKLQIQENGSVKIEFCEIDDEIDNKFKPGLYQQVLTFLNEELIESSLCTLEEQENNMQIYTKISGEEY